MALVQITIEHYHHHECAPAALVEIIAGINSLKEQIMATQAELEVSLESVRTDLQEASTELVAKIAALEAAILAAGNTTPAIDGAMAAIKTLSTGLAGIVPNA